MNIYYQKIFAVAKKLRLFSFLAIVLSYPLSAASKVDQNLSLETAVFTAVKYDPWLTGNRHQQDALESMSIAAGTLPDPKVSLGIANIAAETFDFNQEMMTQFKVGVSQMLPRGDSLAIKQRQLQLMASEYPFQRDNRKAKITVTVSQLWLDIFKAQQSIALIENDRALFEQLADIAQASYASTLGKTRQQDIVRAQLELTRLDDRLSMLNQQKEMRIQQLSEWLNNYFSADYISGVGAGTEPFLQYNLQLVVSTTLPNTKMLFPEIYLDKKMMRMQKMSEYLSQHPSILALEQRIKASKSGINLAKQNYKPAWGLKAGYGYRADDSSGRERADFFSIGVSFDIPLFTSNRQDKQVQAAISKSAAVKTKKWMMVIKMIAAVESSRAQLNRLIERQTLYQDKLLPQMYDQAEASLTAYTNDDGDFAEVIRSKIAQLNASIDSLGIDVEIQKNIVQLNYFFMKHSQEIILSALSQRTSLGELK